MGRRKYKGKCECSLGTTMFFICLISKALTLILSIILNIIISVNPLFTDAEKIKEEIYENSPFFNFNIGKSLPSSDYTYYNRFYTWQGMSKKEKSGRSTKTKILSNPVKISVLYQNRFFYKNINKTYFDYLDYSVKENEKCKDNYKKCGILDSKNNTLCML